MILFKKIKAGALQYVLVISVIIAVIIFAFISLIFLQQRMSIKHNFTKQVIYNTQIGFDYFKSNTIPYNEKTNLSFLEDEQTNTSIIKKHWGVFDIAIVESSIKNEKFRKIGLLGLQNTKRDALFLKENNQSLVLVGKTVIKGNVTLPKLGVKSGSISGVSYYGNKLIYGNRKQSTSFFPEIKNLKYLNKLNSNYYNDSIVYFELEEGIKVHQSFAKRTLLHEDFNKIILSNITLKGNVLVVSKASIRVKSSSKLEGIILIAPKIIIEENTKGNFQAIATQKIEVQSNCLLRYPSGIILLEKNKNIKLNMKSDKVEGSQIFIAKNTLVKGVVVFSSDNSVSNYSSHITVDEKARVFGEVYCQKNLELKGSIFGSVYTNNFIINKNGRIYINHILNGEINSKKLPEQYVGLQINQESNSIAKWVD